MALQMLDNFYMYVFDALEVGPKYKALEEEWFFITSDEISWAD